MRRDGRDLYAYFEVMEMWLSKRVMADRDAEDPAYVAGMPQEGTKGLRAGEVMLFSKGASVKVTNDGKILLHGDVYVQGDLYVNGQKMEVP